MIPWLPWERRWRDALLAAMIPRVPHSSLPGLDELDLAGFWPRFFAKAPPLLRFGLRLAVWLLTWAPPFLLARFRTFRGLAPAHRDQLLERAAHHRRYLVRQLTLTIKLAACFAFLSDPRVRDGLDPDRSAPLRQLPPASPEIPLSRAEPS